MAAVRPDARSPSAVAPFSSSTGGYGVSDGANYIQGGPLHFIPLRSPWSNQLPSFCCFIFPVGVSAGRSDLANPGEIGRRQTAPAQACYRCRRSTLRQSSGFTERARCDGRRYSPSTPGSSSRRRMLRRTHAMTIPPGANLFAPTDSPPMSLVWRRARNHCRRRRPRSQPSHSQNPARRRELQVS